MSKIFTQNFLMLLAAFALGALVLLIAAQTDLDVHGQRLLAVFTVIIVIWATGCMNLSVSCMLLLVLMPLAITDFTGGKEGVNMGKAFRLSLGGFSGDVPITVIAGTAFAAVIRSSGLAERIVYLIMRLIAGRSGSASPSRALGALFLADIPASIMIPSATGRCALYMSIAEGFEKPFKFNKLDNGGEPNPFQKAVWIAVALIPIIMGGAFLTGAEATIMAGGLIAQGTNVPQFWTTTFALLFAPALLVMFFSWFFLVRLFPSTVKSINSSFINERIEQLGALTYKEKYCLFTLIAMIALFLTDTIHKIPTPLILLLVSVVLFIPGVGAGSWKKEGKEIAWDGYFIIGAALGFSNLLSTYKVMNFMAAKISLLNIHSYAMALLVMIIATLIIRLGIASITSAAALLVPISIVVGQAAGLTTFQIVGLAWITYSFCRISFFLPHQGAQLIMTFGINFYRKNDLLLSASYITAAAVVIYGLWAYFFVSPILGALL